MTPIEFRRHLHRHPELSFEEHATAAFITEQLQAAGIPCRPIAKTGVLATIRGRHTTAEDRRAVVLRADIDALPITEQTGLQFASQQPGVMHACGHDMHAAMLYGALCALAAEREFSGTVFGLFQPGEECNPGGASLVLQEQPFADYEVVAVLGQHVDWQLEVGQIGLRAGAFMAASDEVCFTVEGRGGHGAMRHLLIDPIEAACSLVSRLLTINRTHPNAVLSIGHIEGLGATNVVPNEVRLEGTLRTFDEAERTALHASIAQQAAEIDSQFGTHTVVDINHGYPSVQNNAALVEALTEPAQAAGFEVLSLDRRMLAEDFGFYTLHYPSLFWRIGVGADSGRSHTATYAPSEECIDGGIRLMEAMAHKLLQR